MLIIGLHFFVWGSILTEQRMHCGQCGTVAQFVRKRGMRFITIFFIIPVIPVSGITHIVQCPNCKTRYQSQA
ncbi:MAG TPA: hypothetical protein VFD58_37165 [Blastocatellia bacterium]|nr:hypothetical protein [Blastocatellia bacterium]